MRTHATDGLNRTTILGLGDGQPARHAGLMPEITGLHHAALSVGDLDRSVRWYGEVLWAEEVFRDEGDSRRMVVLRMPGAGPVVGLVQHGEPGTRQFDPANIGLDALALGVDSLAQLEAWIRHLSGLGVEHSGIMEIPPGAIVNFKDPDGIALVLFWNRPPMESG